MNEESRTSEAIAADPATPPGVLEQLAQNDQPMVTRAVAANPNTPLTTLLWLSEQHMTEFTRNPALPLHLLVDAHALADMPEVGAGQLLRDPDLSPLLLEGLRHHNAPIVSKAANAHVAVAGEAGTEWQGAYRANFLATPSNCHKYSTVHMLLQALNDPPVVPYILSSIFDLLLDHPQQEYVLMIYPFTPPCQLRMNPGDGTYLAVNPNRPVDMLPWLARTRGAQSGAIQHPQVASAILAQIIWSERKFLEEPRIRMLHKNSSTDFVSLQRQVAHAAHTPEALLMELATSDEVPIRTEVARNPTTPVPTLMQFLHDTSLAVRCAAMRHPRMPQHIITQRWSQQMGSEERLALAISLAANPSTPSAILATLAYHEHYEVREGIAENPSSPPITLEHLANDSHPLINCLIAQHPATPTHVVTRLANETNVYVLAGVAQNLTTSFAKAWQLAQRDYHISSAIRQRADFTLDQQKQILSLVMDQTLATKCRQNSIIVASILLSSPLVTAEVLAREVERPWHWLVRCAITYNPNISTAVLHILAHDGIRYVRAAARERLMEQEKAAALQT